MTIETVHCMEADSYTGVSEFDVELDLENTSTVEPFVGALGLSAVRELAWANGLMELDEPAPWESL